jgi:FkbM family methyltransferase
MSKDVRHAIITNSDKEPQEILLQELFTAQMPLCIFDIGACEGESSIRYAKFFPAATIYAIEPLPKNFEWVQEHIRKYDTSQVKAFQTCFSNSVGEVPFYVSSGKPPAVEIENWDFGNKSSSLLAPNQIKATHQWMEFKEVIKVQTTTLDLFCEQHQIRHIDFIHMDVQGAELMVLEGGSKMLPTIQMIWLEVEAIELYKGQPVKTKIEQFMQQQGYVKLIDTVDNVAGDQFWARKAYIVQHKSLFFIWAKQWQNWQNRTQQRLQQQATALYFTIRNQAGKWWRQLKN